MTTKCKRCERATDLFVCKACISELRKRLADLPWWLDRLAETAVGQSRLGDRGRRGGRRDVLHGDDTLESHVEPFPSDKDTPPTSKDRRDRQRAALHHALALGHVNGRASEELDRISNVLSTTIRDMCETRGIELPEFRTAPNVPPANESETTRSTVPPGCPEPLRPDLCARCFVTLPTSAEGPLCDDCDGAPELPQAAAEHVMRVSYAGRRHEDTLPVTTIAQMARWLFNYAADVALQENGSEVCDEIEHVYRAATRVVNRPPEPLIIGPCITDPAPDEVIQERIENGDNATRCGYALTAKYEGGAVTCPQCECVHLVSEVLRRNLDELDDRNVTVRELVDVVLPRLDEHVPVRTVERWIRYGWVAVRGHDAAGHQMVRIGDVRNVRAERPRNAKARN